MTRPVQRELKKNRTAAGLISRLRRFQCIIKEVITIKNIQEFISNETGRQQGLKYSLKNEIEQCQKLVSQAQSTDDYWKANRELAARLFAYQLYQDKGVTEVEIVRKNNGSLEYVSNNGNMNHYGIVKYKDASGKWHEKYMTMLLILLTASRQNSVDLTDTAI